MHLPGYGVQFTVKFTKETNRTKYLFCNQKELQTAVKVCSIST